MESNLSLFRHWVGDLIQKWAAAVMGLITVCGSLKFQKEKRPTHNILRNADTLDSTSTFFSSDLDDGKGTDRGTEYDIGPDGLGDEPEAFGLRGGGGGGALLTELWKSEEEEEVRRGPVSDTRPSFKSELDELRLGLDGFATARRSLSVRASVDVDVPDANISNLDLRFLTAWRDSESISDQVIAERLNLDFHREIKRAGRCVENQRAKG